jgi:addiction module HigA family antidote
MAKIKQSPGILLLGFLEKYGYNCNSLSKEIKCSQTALRLISLDKSRITTSIAVRLAKFFGTKPEFWLLAQMNYDLAKAASKKSLQKQLKGISKAGTGKPAKAGKKRKAAFKKKAGKRRGRRK